MNLWESAFVNGRFVAEKSASINCKRSKLEIKQYMPPWVVAFDVPIDTSPTLKIIQIYRKENDVSIFTVFTVIC